MSRSWLSGAQAKRSERSVEAFLYGVLVVYMYRASGRLSKLDNLSPESGLVLTLLLCSAIRNSRDVPGTRSMFNLTYLAQLISL